MDIIKELIGEERADYKCFDEIKRLIKENEQFKEIIEKGIIEGKITAFPESLWEKIQNQNIRRIDSFESVFRDGANIGYCTVASKQLSYSLPTCYICGGTLPILKGTSNCPDGRHTWISYNNSIIDTTLMLIIDDEYAYNIGYIEENRYDPNSDPIYRAAKEFTNDPNLNRGR